MLSAGMKVSSTPVTVDGRVLETPRVVFGGDSVVVFCLFFTLSQLRSLIVNLIATHRRRMECDEPAPQQTREIDSMGSCQFRARFIPRSRDTVCEEPC